MHVKIGLLTIFVVAGEKLIFSVSCVLKIIWGDKKGGSGFPCVSSATLCSMESVIQGVRLILHLRVMSPIIPWVTESVEDVTVLL